VGEGGQCKGNKLTPRPLENCVMLLAVYAPTMGTHIRPRPVEDGRVRILRASKGRR